MPPLLPGEPGDGHGEDGEDGDDVGYVPPLPPEDRLWRHPSEVASARSAAAPASHPRSDRRTASLMLLSGMVGATLALGTAALLGGFDERVVERQVAVRSTDVLDDAPDGVATVTDRTAGSVVAIRAERDGEHVHASAVAFRSDGYLLTDGPSVAGADDIDVVLRDGPAGTARLVGIDDVTGIAVLHLDTELRPAALPADPGAVAVGEPAVAIGASLEGGWDATVSAGVIAAVNRRLEADDGTTRHGMILVDTPFAPGTAGGALVDGAGVVVGIVSGGQASGSGASFGVATPIDVARHVAEQIAEHGHAQHVRLGVHGSDLDIDAAAAMGLAGGALVKSAEADGPAHRAGIEAGDVITAVDDDPTPTMSALIASLRRRLPGDVVVLAVRRDGEVLDVRVTLEPLG